MRAKIKVPETIERDGEGNWQPAGHARQITLQDIGAAKAARVAKAPARSTKKK
jgi:hypothetical protein